MHEIDRLNARIIRCVRCPRLVAHRRLVAVTKRREYRDWEYWGRPLPGFGDPHASVLVVGLAPAAHGGNRTGRIFTGDRSGDWLYEALYRYGFANQARSEHREDGLRLTGCYVVAAVRCAPPANKPAPAEFDACREYLREELRLLKNLRVVIALGKIAFDQYLKTCCFMGHPRVQPALRFSHGAEYRLPWALTLLGSYHPSQQNTFTGKLTRPMFHSVFRRARKILDEGPARFDTFPVAD
jgi:uracil-DNA glycosylase family 4